MQLIYIFRNLYCCFLLILYCRGDSRLRREGDCEVNSSARRDNLYFVLTFGRFSDLSMSQDITIMRYSIWLPLYSWVDETENDSSELSTYYLLVRLCIYLYQLFKY